MIRRFYCDECEEEHEVDVPDDIDQRMADVEDAMIECKRMTKSVITKLKESGFNNKLLGSETIIHMSRTLSDMYYMRFLSQMHCDRVLEDMFSRQIVCLEQFLQEKKYDPIRDLSLFMYGVQVKGHQREAEDELKHVPLAS